MTNKVSGPPGVPPRSPATTGKLEVFWRTEVVKALDELDRYTRNDITTRFREDPRKGAVELDAAARTFKTPIEGTRYSVLWTLDPATNGAVATALEKEKKSGWFG